MAETAAGDATFGVSFTGDASFVDGFTGDATFGDGLTGDATFGDGSTEGTTFGDCFTDASVTGVALARPRLLRLRLPRRLVMAIARGSDFERSLSLGRILSKA